MASATRVDGIVAFANAGENLQPAATAAVEARPQGNADARPALAADRCACWAPALSIEPWISPGRVARRVVAVALGRVAVAFFGTRGGAAGVGRVSSGAAGVGSASTATGAAIAAAGRLGCSIDGLLGGPLLLVSAPGAACMAPFVNQCGGCCSLVGTCCHKIERAASVATTESLEMDLGPEERPAPAARSSPKSPSEACEAYKEERRLNDHLFGASFLIRSCLSHSSSARWGRVPI